MLRIAEALQEAGVRDEELNVHWWGGQHPERTEFNLARAILARGFAFRSWLYTETTREATGTIREIGADNVAYAVRVPPVVTDPSSLDRQLEELAAVIDYAKSLGLAVGVLLIDIGRSDFESMVRVANESIKLGATRLRLQDSTSSLSPDALRLVFRRFRSRLIAPIKLQVHAHDDFGLATANALTAVTVGVNPEVSVNGISYRGGFASMEEVVTALELMYGLHTGLRLDHMRRLSEMVAEYTGLPNHPVKPVTGTHMFLRDNPDAQLEYIKRGPDAFPMPNSCIAPSLVGGTFKVVWGNRYSPLVIVAKLEQLGLAPSDDLLLHIQQRIESRLSELKTYPKWLTEEEVNEICRAVAPVFRNS